MSDIQEEQKRIYKRAEENDIDAYKMYRKIQEQAKVYEEYDNFDREDLIDELEEEKRINEYNLEEINRLNNIIYELTEEYINYMDKQDFAKKCNISRPYLDKLLKKMSRKEIYEFCKIRNKLKEK